MIAGAQGISPDQGPPLAIPLRFFATAPLALAVAGAALIVRGSVALSSRSEPETLALVHLGTLGFLLMVMIGALYQLVPVIGGTPLRGLRRAPLLHGLLLVGAGSLIYGLATGGLWSFRVALAVLLPALLGFVALAAVALLRASADGDSVRGMKLSVLGFLVALSLGVALLLGRAGLFWVEDWGRWVIAHAGLALSCWVGMLICAVSWQVVPMFYMTAPFPPVLRRLELGLVLATLILVPVSLFASEELEPLFLALLPGALAVGLLHPIAVVVLLARRKRKKVGHSVQAWFGAAICAPAALLAAAGAAFGDDPRWSLLFGWLSLVGWAGLTVHGMLSRIVPFLVWFHASAARIGFEPVPSMRELLPEPQLLVQLALHAATVLAGAVAILTGSDALARTTGALLMLTAAALVMGVLSPVVRARQSRAP